MTWTPEHRELFTRTVTQYWDYQQKKASLMGFYADELEKKYPVASVLTALKDIKRSEDSSRLPALKTICEKLQRSTNGDAHAPTTHRQDLVAQLGKLAEKRAVWLSPKGVMCRVADGALVHKKRGTFQGHPHEYDSTLPYTDIPEEGLEAILREAEIGAPGPGEARIEEVTYVPPAVDEEGEVPF